MDEIESLLISKVEAEARFLLHRLTRRRRRHVAAVAAATAATATAAPGPRRPTPHNRGQPSAFDHTPRRTCSFPYLDLVTSTQ